MLEAVVIIVAKVECHVLECDAVRNGADVACSCMLKDNPVNITLYGDVVKLAGQCVFASLENLQRFAGLDCRKSILNGQESAVADLRDNCINIIDHCCALDDHIVICSRRIGFEYVQSLIPSLHVLKCAGVKDDRCVSIDRANCKTRLFTEVLEIALRECERAYFRAIRFVGLCAAIPSELAVCECCITLRDPDVVLIRSIGIEGAVCESSFTIHLLPIVLCQHHCIHKINI